MTPPPPPLLEAAVRPFHNDAERRDAALQLLGEPDENANSQEILNRWEETDRAKRPRLWKVLFISLSLLVCGILGGIHGVEILRFVGFYQSVTNLHMDGEVSGFFKYLEPPLEKSLSDRNRYLLGDPDLPRLENTRRLWQTDPDNPAWFARYTTVHLTEENRLPDDFLATTRRIDPENSWFLYQAAGKLARDSIESVFLSYQQRKANEHKQWKILDEEKYRESLALFREAARLPKFDSYESSNALARMDLMPKETPLQNIQAIGSIAFELAGIIPLRKLGDIAAAEASRLKKAEDLNGLKAHLTDCEAFMVSLNQPDDLGLIAGLVNFTIARMLSPELETSARALGLTEEADKWMKRKEAVEQRREFLHSHRSAPQDSDKIAGILSSLPPQISSLLQNPPPVQPEEYAPIRELEHSLFSRACTLAGCLLAGIFLLFAFLGRWKNTKLIRKLSSRMEKLLRPVDWAWILGFGVLFPCLYVLAIQYLTPLGGRQFNLHVPGFRPAAYFHLAMVLLCLSGSLSVANWRLRSRMAAFQIPGSIPHRSWAVCFVIGLILVPLNGAVLLCEPLENWNEWISEKIHDEMVIQDAFMMLWCFLFLLLLVCSLFSSGKNALIQATATRAILPALAFSMLFIGLTLPVLRASEFRNMRRDTLLMPNPEFPGITPYETKAALQLRKEVREILGLEAE